MVAPSASAASRWSRGTARRTSRDTESTNGTIMMARTIPAVRKPIPYDGPLKKRQKSQRLFQRRLNGGSHDRHQQEHAQQTVNHAGNRRQQIADKCEGRRKLRGRKLGQKNRRPHAERNRDDQRDRRGHQRAVNEGQRAEIAGDRIPGFRDEEFPSELGPRFRRKNPELINQEDGNQQKRRRRNQRDEMRDIIRAGPAARQRLRIPGDIRRRCRVWCGGHFDVIRLPGSNTYWILCDRFHFLGDDFLRQFCVRQPFAVLLPVRHHPLQEILHGIALARIAELRRESAAR